MSFWPPARRRERRLLIPNRGPTTTLEAKQKSASPSGCGFFWGGVGLSIGGRATGAGWPGHAKRRLRAGSSPAVHGRTRSWPARPGCPPWVAGPARGVAVGLLKSGPSRTASNVSSGTESRARWARPGPCLAMDGRTRAHRDVLVACPGRAHLDLDSPSAHRHRPASPINQHTFPLIRDGPFRSQRDPVPLFKSLPYAPAF